VLLKHPLIRQQQTKFAKNLQGYNFCAIMN
jgi:hypothetical protein